MTRTFQLMIVTVAAFTASVTVAQEAELSWQFSSGDAFSIQYVQSDKFASRIDTRDRSVESEVTLNLDWSVTAVDGQGTATIDQTITRVQLNSGAPGEEEKRAIELDTASDAPLRGVSRNFMKLVKPLVGLKYSLQLDKSGKLLSVSVDQATQAKLDEIHADNQFSKVVQPKAMQAALAKSLALPARKLEADQAWDDADQIDFGGGKLDRTTTWKVGSINAESAELEMTMQLDQDENANAAAAKKPAREEGAITGPPKIQAYSGSGSVVFDRKAGHVRSVRMDSEIKVRTTYRTDFIDTTLKSVSQTTIAKKE